MVSKEDFVEVWKDSSRESILNQFYYEHKILQEEYNNWNELKEWLKLWVEEEKKLDDLVTHYYSLGDLIEDKEVILDKIQELESRK